MNGQREIITPEQEFWNWFSIKEADYRNINSEIHQSKLDKFLAKLHNYHPNLFYTIGGHPDAEIKELIITAEGQHEYFSVVEHLVEKAPQLDNWSITAFKPPRGFEFTIQYGNIILKPEDIHFVPLEHPDHPDLVGIRIFVEDYEDEKEDMYYSGMNLLLQTALGEKIAAQDLEYWDVSALPSDLNFKIHPLENLIKFIEWKKENRTAS